MDKEELRKLIVVAARRYDLDPDFVEGFCRQESSCDPWAARYEPAFYDRYIKPLKVGETEGRLRATSFGLMQVMGQVARELGFKDKWLTALCDPAIALDYGCRHLKNKLLKYGLKGGIAAYNSGSPRVRKDGKYENQSYVDGILKHVAMIQNERG